MKLVITLVRRLLFRIMILIYQCHVSEIIQHSKMKPKEKPRAQYFCDGKWRLSKHLPTFFSLDPARRSTSHRDDEGNQGVKYSLLVILVVWNIGCVFRWGLRRTSKFTVRAGRSGVWIAVRARNSSTLRNFQNGSGYRSSFPGLNRL